MPPVSGQDRRTAALVRNRQQIVTAAQRLFAERGFAGTSVVRIARDAGLASTTVFNHFPHKEELFFEGRCPWAEISGHLAEHPDRHTTAAELIELVATVVAAHLEHLREPTARAALVDLTSDADLVLWERGLRRTAERAVAGHIARHADHPVDAEADRCAALTIAELGTVVDEHRRAALASDADAVRPAAPVRDLLVRRIGDLHDLVVAQVAGPPASR